MDSNPISWLTFFTLAGGFVIIAGAFLYFLRSRENRYRAEAALVGTENPSSSPTPDGALPELIGVLVLALIVMGLLALGYSYR